MPPRSARGARKAPLSVAQYRRVVASLERLTALVERNIADIEKIRDEQRIHLKRVGQLQVELDAIKRAWERMRTPD